MNHLETVPTKIDKGPMRIPNTTVNPATPHVLRRAEAPPLSLLPGERVGVGLDSVKVGEGDTNTEDKDEGGGGNEIDVFDGPTLQNL